MKVMQAMTRNVVCIREEDNLQRAFDLMKEWDIRHLPVTTQGKLVGLVSDRDILAYSAWPGHQRMQATCVSDVMTRKIITASPGDPISHIANIMSLNKIDCIPVLENDNGGELVGLVTSMDLIDLLREKEILDLSRAVPWTYTVQNYCTDSSAMS